MTPPAVTLPRWLKPMNRVFIALNRLGMGPSGMSTLTVPGRTSGKLRVTPVSVMTFEGDRYVVSGFPGADWVKNARAARVGTLSRRRHDEVVTLVELTKEQAKPVLRAFPVLVPTAISMMKDAGVVKSDSPAEFETLAGRCAVFRLDPAAS